VQRSAAPRDEAAPARAIVLQVVEAVVRLRQFREAPRGDPVEASRVDQQPADHRVVAAQEHGCRVVDEIGSVLERSDQPGRRDGRIDQMPKRDIV
jgi:hypothetical protein